MSLKKTQAENDSRDPIIVEAQRYRDQRANTYREQALKIYPWICARCGREFSGKKLRELTVHHRDHNHDCSAPGFLDSGLTVFASMLPRPARRNRVALGLDSDSRTSPASTVRCTSA